MGLSGMRTATVSSPPVVRYGTASLFFTTRVSGPGQKVSIRLTMVGLKNLVNWPMSLAREMWTIIGLSEGRPFAS